MSNDMTQVHQGQIVEFGAHLVSKAEWISEPAAISWLPQTLIWTLFGLMIVVGVISVVVRRQWQQLKRTYLRQAWLRFNEIEQRGSPADFAPLIKQLAHQHWPQANVGAMTNTDFARFIASIPNQCLSESQVLEVMDVSYAPQPTLNPQTQRSLHAWFKDVTC